jgi:hypothetical protein
VKRNTHYHNAATNRFQIRKDNNFKPTRSQLMRTEKIKEDDAKKKISMFLPTVISSPKADNTSLINLTQNVDLPQKVP